MQAKNACPLGIFVLFECRGPCDGLPKEPQFCTLCNYKENDMTKTLSLKEARNQFSDIVDRAGRLSERVVVTRNGRPEAVVMGVDEFESWVETLELLSNPKAVKSLKQGLKEAKAGKFHSFKEGFGEEQ
jgi:prevent-host-death family protein